LIALFAAALAAPSVDMWISPDELRGPEKAEQRAAALRPSLGFESVMTRSFPERFGKYFDDVFGLRDVLLRWHSIEKLFVFGVSSTPSVMLGRDDWMFYTKDHSIEIFRGAHPFSTAQLERWRRALESRRDYLAQRGIEFIYVIGPNKETIYPDYVPPRCNRVGPTRLDQLTAYLEQRSDFRILDLRPALTAARADDRPLDHVYLELGTHWNARGGFVAAREIQKWLHARFPSVNVSEPADVVFGTAEDRGDTEAGWMYVPDLFPQHWNWYMPKAPRVQLGADGWSEAQPHRVKVDDPRLPRALVLHDSFGPGVAPLLSECFSRSTWINTAAFNADLIAAESPDVLIQVYVERVLDQDPLQLDASTFRTRPARAADARSVHYRFDPRNGSSAWEAKGRLEVARDDDGASMSLVMRDGGDAFLLPEFEWPSKRGVVVDVDITAPAGTALTLFYLLPGQAQYDRKSAVSAELTRGPNRVTLEIPRCGPHGRLMIRPGAELGHYVVHGLEVRTLDAH